MRTGLGQLDKLFDLHAANERPRDRLAVLIGDAPADGAETVSPIKLIRQLAYQSAMLLPGRVRIPPPFN
jgi:hypothetical protein